MNKYLKKGIVFCIMTLLLVGNYTSIMAANNNNNSYNYEKPRIVVTGFEVENDAIIPGETFNLVIKIKNPSEKYSVSSVLISHTNQVDSVFTVYGQSDQLFIRQLKPLQERELKISLKASERIETQTVKFELKFEYSDAASSTNLNVAAIQIPVMLKSKLEVQTVSLPDTVTTAGKTRMRVTYKNSGSEDLYNITMNIASEGMKEAEQINLGTLSAGKVSYVEAYVSFVKTGSQTAKISFSYEDMAGNVSKTASHDAAVSVTDKKVNNDTEITQNEDDMMAVQVPQASLMQKTILGFKAWQVGLGGSIFVMAIIVFILVRKYKK